MNTILIVDDEAEDLKYLKNILEGAKYKVITASTQDSAMNLLKPDRVSVAVIDVKLKKDDPVDRSGIEVARNSSRDIPKIMISKATEDAQLVRDAFGTDADGRVIVLGFLTKKEVKETPAKLVETVKSAFDARANWDRSARQSVQGQLLSDYESARRFDRINTGVGFVVNVIFVGLIILTIYWIHSGTAQVVLSSIACLGIVISEVVLNLFLAKRLEGSGHRAENYHDELIDQWRFEQLLKSAETMESPEARNEMKQEIIRSFAAGWNRKKAHVSSTELTVSGKESF
jgi:CheY-like chemotaxis protein